MNDQILNANSLWFKSTIGLYFMKNKVLFIPNDNGLYQAVVNDQVIPLLLAHHQTINTINLLEPFKNWEKEDNDYFRMLVAGACRIAMCDKI